MTEERYQGLSALGDDRAIPRSPDQAELEVVDDPHPEELYLVRFTAPLVIDYAPDAQLVESKSLKMFLTSFRDHGAFHEDCTLTIAKRIKAAIQPRWLRIAGYWYPRGGIPIDVFYQTDTPPEGLWLPDTGVAPYRGRG